MQPEWWMWLGGRPALDFVNTAHDERLHSVADVVDWLVRARLLARPMRAPHSILAEARQLRGAIDAGVRAAVSGAAPDPAALALVNDWLALGGSRTSLHAGADGHPVLSQRPTADSPRRALGAVALDAARMLGISAERERLRICAADECAVRFYDRSPGGRRRWCSMALCGNRAKARAYRARAA
jgi:predicted RNA-binding Zn ribbon-like protein